MLTRRLKFFFFFNDTATTEIYTPAGFQWVKEQNLRSVIERHCPSLRPRFAELRNIFFPWDRAGS